MKSKMQMLTASKHCFLSAWFCWPIHSCTLHNAEFALIWSNTGTSQNPFNFELALNKFRSLHCSIFVLVWWSVFASADQVLDEVENVIADCFQTLFLLCLVLLTNTFLHTAQCWVCFYLIRREFSPKPILFCFGIQQFQDGWYLLHLFSN